jgi:hypothetical protein
MNDGPNPFYIKANLLILFIALLAMLAIYGYAKMFGTPRAVLIHRFRSAACAFWLFFAGYACLFFLYMWIYFYLRAGQSLQSFASSPAVDIGTDILGNTANLCFLAAAVAYCRGRTFNYIHASGTIILLTVFITIWAFGWNALGRSDDLFVKSIQYAPELVLPTVAFVALGWAFFARWGGVAGVLFFVVALIYALLQVPANLMASFGEFLVKPNTLGVTFSYLAAGKILLAFGFLSLLCSSSLPAVRMNQPKYWPDEAITPAKWMRQVGGWVISLVAAIAVAMATQFKCDILKLVSLSCT